MSKCPHCNKEITGRRTPSQNKSLHKLFDEVSDMCMEKGVDMRHIVKEEIPIPATPENIKWLWKQLQEVLFKTKSTTELKKTGEIDVVYDTFNRILIERTNGEISLPPFPSEEHRSDTFQGIELSKQVEYPENDLEDVKF